MNAILLSNTGTKAIALMFSERNSSNSDYCKIGNAWRSYLDLNSQKYLWSANAPIPNSYNCTIYSSFDKHSYEFLELS